MDYFAASYEVLAAAIKKAVGECPPLPEQPSQSAGAKTATPDTHADAAPPASGKVADAKKSEQNFTAEDMFRSACLQKFRSASSAWAAFDAVGSVGGKLTRTDFQTVCSRLLGLKLDKKQRAVLRKQMDSE